MPLLRPDGQVTTYLARRTIPRYSGGFAFTTRGASLVTRRVGVVVVHKRRIRQGRGVWVRGIERMGEEEKMMKKEGDDQVSEQPVDLTALSHSELIARVNELESRLKSVTARVAGLSTPRDDADGTLNSRSSPTRSRLVKPKKAGRPIDFSRYATRHVALKFAYLGQRYNGLEHTNGMIPPGKPTIEEALWKGLRKARLIPVEVPEGCDGSFDVVFGEGARRELYWKEKVRLELDWTGLGYSKCGRTDRGVSAFGQVVGVTVRSNRPRESGEDGAKGAVFDDIKDELPYISILNTVLPPDIRVLAWSPDPDGSFDARFTCRERRYKYFFTNPAFCPTPSPLGLNHGNGDKAPAREGWLDIEAMRKAAKKLEGHHDFRNFCKIDASKQMSSCERRITFADIEEMPAGIGMSRFSTDLNLNETGRSNDVADATHPAAPSMPGPKVYTFAVHGTAFLWHQVRCMVAVLFLVGQGLEKPEIIDELLDIIKTPGKPQYDMADDAPLVLWDCVFPGDEAGDEEGLQWIYAGDEVSVSAVTRKGDNYCDGKFGIGGLINELWEIWRKAKMRETLTAGLLSLALNQGDGSSLRRGGYRPGADTRKRSQRIFDGGDGARHVGNYVPAMRKAKLDTLEVTNARFLAGKQARRIARKSHESTDD